MKIRTSGRPGTSQYSILFVPATAVLLFLVFLGYYSSTAWYLPRGAGPDSQAHYDVARFIHDHQRLAVIPADLDSLMLTPYGSTRALRPPLSYLVSAAVAGVIDDGNNLFKALRLGSGLLCAVTVALVFAGLWLMFERYWLALGGALLFGLLPQFAFIASYTNDDSGAIFSATALVASMIWILRKGLNRKTAAVFGLSTGLVILSKFTAWLLLPTAACFVLLYLWRDRQRATTHMVIILVALLVGGGWWILFNISHYGIDDPLLANVSNQISQEHARVEDPGSRGYLSKGIDASSLLLHNYRNFIGESFKSTVGNLDWLRLRVGWLQYGLYGSILALAVLYLPFRLVPIKFPNTFGKGINEPEGSTYFYCILLAMVVLQVFMYVRFNLYHDIQVQGKYMLPVFLPVLVLASASLVGLSQMASARFQAAAFKFIFGLLVFGAIVGVHVHALRVYVLPFYFQTPMTFEVNDFHYVDLTNLNFVKGDRDVELIVTDDGVLARSFSVDPQIELDPQFCGLLSPNFIVQLVLDAADEGNVKLYVDQGNGYSETSAAGKRYTPGENHIVIPFGIDDCKALRLDPSAGAIEVTIKRIGFATMKISEN